MKSWTYALGTLGLAVILSGCGDGTQADPLAEFAEGPPPCCELEATPPRIPVAAEATPQGAEQTEPVDTEDVGPMTPAMDDEQALEVLAATHSGEWLEPADREVYNFDFDFTDQDGEPFNLSSYLGKPLAMSFIFTRCSNPYMCPMITAQMATLESKLESAGLAGKVNLVLLTYDPVYDTPERLKRYGEARGMKFVHSKMLRPEGMQFRELLVEFGITAWFGPKGVENHTMDLYLFDKEGRRVRYYINGVWDNEEVLGDLQRLLDESGNAA